VMPRAAFDNDPTFQQAVDLIGRLEETSKKTGRGLGVKFSNTLVVENEGDFLPKAEKTSYLSGQPLHVLAMNLVGRFRGAFGDRLPVSFSAGIDKQNFPDAVALGLKPVTVCSDLLRPGGYGRASAYFQDLGKRMDDVGATDLDTWTLRAHGKAAEALEKVSGIAPAQKAACVSALEAKGDLRAAAGAHFAAWVSEARLLNTKHYVDGLLGTPRYAAAANAKPPNKVGTKLDLFDCITCDKCVPVCPNHANFSYVLPAVELPVVKLRKSGEQWTSAPAQTLKIAKKRQYANFADFCNECGNCDVFCPEDGGPYVVKPRFFGSREQFHKWTTHDGFFVTRDEVLGRFQGQAYRLAQGGTVFGGPGFELTLDTAKPESPTGGTAEAGVEVDLTYFHILRWLHGALLDGPLTYVNA